MYTVVLSKEFDVLCPDAFPLKSSKICGEYPTPSYNPEQPAVARLIGMLRSYPS